METQELLKVISLLLDYPQEETYRLARLLEEELSPSTQYYPYLKDFLTYYRENSLSQLQHNYVSTFDFSTTNNLYLTYHRFGDKRERGELLANLKGLYYEKGFDIATNELPDYLPLMLEFASQVDPCEGLRLLGEYKREIEKIYRSLEGNNSPYKNLLKIVLLVLEENLSKETLKGGV
ncbi:MAG: nitrate reductase molybdenum cofactor assembly chaperone [Aquificae bacterium]|nr:nitrate reductase molybdenum cofactor assembly chaperone [Aquificota bacterium]